MEDDQLEERDEQGDRQQQRSDADPERDPLAIHPGRGGEDLSPRSPACQAKRSRRMPGRARKQEEEQQREPGEEQPDLERMVHELHERPGAAADGSTEDARRGRPERAGPGNRVAARAPVLRPADRLGPLGLQVRAGGAVEERRLQLPPAALEGDPGNAARARASSLGIVFTTGRTSNVGPRVSSQPTPSEAELPR